MIERSTPARDDTPGYALPARRPDVAPRDGVPLVVDVDGTLLRGDLLAEGLVQIVLQRPWQLGPVLVAASRGRGALKEAVASRAAIDPASLPVNDGVRALVREAQAAGRPVVLASEAHVEQLTAIGRALGAVEVMGSTPERNLQSAAKLAAVRARFPEFDYVGDAPADAPLWAAARTAYVTGTSAAGVAAARASRPDARVLAEPAPRAHTWAQALRVHQWSKNLLMVLPAAAAHLAFTTGHLLQLLVAFVAFSLVSSAVYVLNDLVDLSQDRAHPRKRTRPFAHGDLSPLAGLIAACVLLGEAAVLATGLPRAFGITLLAYFALTCAYTWALKHHAVADVLTLTMLYVARIVAGAAALAVPLSRWLLPFSIFFFLSLAIVKRVVELRGVSGARRDGAGSGVPELVGLPGRGYAVADLPVLLGLGLGATCMSALVYCLYVTSPEAAGLYARPALLWAGLPLFLYWSVRTWLLAHRGRMDDDPVVFALRDRASWVVVGAFVIVSQVAQW